MFWYNKTLVEFDLVQHQISFAGSSDVTLSFASPNITCPGKTNPDVGLGLIQQVFIVASFSEEWNPRLLRIWQLVAIASL